MSLKNKAISGIKWSFVDNFINQILHFVVGIVLARLLSPSEFGVIGIITVFTSLSQLVVDSGFSQALIRKQDCNESDWNTMLFSNILFGLIMCGILVVIAPNVERFYNVPDVAKLLRLMSLIIVINSFGLVEQTQLIRRVDFKALTLISLSSSVVSGIVGIVLAVMGFSYWSLLWKAIAQNLTRVSLLYMRAKWRPRPMFSMVSFKEMFSFGSKMLLSQFISKGYSNLYYFLVGKYFSVAELGLYTKAEQFKNLPTDGLLNTIQRVTYPVLSQMESRPQAQHEAYRKLIRTSFYVVITAVVGLVFTSKEMITILLGDKWIKTIPYLQILSLSAITLPLRHVNMNIVMVRNKPDMYLKIQVITNLLFIPLVYIGVISGIYALLFIVVLTSVLEYIIIVIASTGITRYPLLMQLKDIAPLVIYALSVSLVQLLIQAIGIDNNLLSLLVKAVTMIVTIVLLGHILKMQEYREMKLIFISQLKVMKIVRERPSVSHSTTNCC